MRSTHCTLYIPGHATHYIKNRQVMDFVRRYPERLVTVALTDLGAGRFSTEPADADVAHPSRLGWNHDPDLVTEIARDSVLGEVQYIPDFEALVRWIGEPGGGSGTIVEPAWIVESADNAAPSCVAAHV
jgi:hypothetical protein